MTTISIIVEDCSKLFEDSKYGELIEEILPPICRLIDVNRFTEEIIATAINTINMLMMTDSEHVNRHVEDYFGELLKIGSILSDVNLA